MCSCRGLLILAGYNNARANVEVHRVDSRSTGRHVVGVPWTATFRMAGRGSEEEQNSLRRMGGSAARLRESVLQRGIPMCAATWNHSVALDLSKGGG